MLVPSPQRVFVLHISKNLDSSSQSSSPTGVQDVITLTSSEGVSSTQEGKTFLDILPQDLRERTAKQFMVDEPSLPEIESGIEILPNLKNVQPPYQAVVREEMEECCHSPSSHVQDSYRYLLPFSQIEIQLGTSIHVIHDTLNKFKIPPQKLTVYYSNKYSVPLDLVPGLYELHINFLSPSKQITFDNLQSLRSISLESQWDRSVMASIIDTKPCILSIMRFKSLDAFTCALSSACPSLLELSIVCQCRSCSFIHLSAGSIPSLTLFSFTMRDGFRGATETSLNSIESIELVGLKSMVTAKAIGANVKSICDTVCNNRDILQCAIHCPNLLKLRLYVRPDLNFRLGSLIGKLSKVKELNLSWPKEGRLKPEFPPRLVYALVRSMPHLEILGLLNLKMSLTELQDVLKEIGTRLLCFTTTIGGQGDAPLERLESLIWCMIRFNKKIEYFSVTDEKIRWYLLDAEITSKAAMYREAYEKASRIACTLRYLQRSFPLLNLLDVFELVDTTADDITRKWADDTSAMESDGI